MSFSMPSAWRPEIRRRPAMSAAFTMPTATIAARTQASTSLPRSVLDALDRDADEDDDRDRGRLGQHGEDRRDDERGLVRLEEPQEPDECLAVRDCAHPRNLATSCSSAARPAPGAGSDPISSRIRSAASLYDGSSRTAVTAARTSSGVALTGSSVSARPSSGSGRRSAAGRRPWRSAPAAARA